MRIRIGKQLILFLAVVILLSGFISGVVMYPLEAG